MRLKDEDNRVYCGKCGQEILDESDDKDMSCIEPWDIVHLCEHVFLACNDVLEGQVFLNHEAMVVRDWLLDQMPEDEEKAEEVREDPGPFIRRKIKKMPDAPEWTKGARIVEVSEGHIPSLGAALIPKKCVAEEIFHDMSWGTWTFWVLP